MLIHYYFLLSVFELLKAPGIEVDEKLIIE